MCQCNRLRRSPGTSAKPNCMCQCSWLRQIPRGGVTGGAGHPALRRSRTAFVNATAGAGHPGSPRCTQRAGRQVWALRRWNGRLVRCHVHQVVYHRTGGSLQAGRDPGRIGTYWPVWER
jgi:hypothetical protein